MGMEMMHISSISACENVGVLCVGNDLEITAHYDTRKYMPMMNADGTLIPVMESRLFCHDWMSGLPTSYPFQRCVLRELDRARTRESKVRVWLRSLDPIDSIG
jgi:hypothetical protein